MEEAQKLLNSYPIYTKEQFNIDMKKFLDNYNPPWKTRTYQREKLRRWRIMNPKKYRDQLDRAQERRTHLGMKEVSREGLIQDATINQNEAD